MKQNLLSKDKTIENLNLKLKNFNDNYNKKVMEIKQQTNENINQTQEQVEQLIIERDELVRKNEELTNGLLNFDNKVKEANVIFTKKTENYNKNLLACKNKIKDYKNKISLLKRKVDELHLVIKKLKFKENIGNLDYSYNYTVNSGRRKEYLGSSFFNNEQFNRQRNYPMPPYNENKDNFSTKNFSRDYLKLNNKYTYEMNENNPEMDYTENQLDISQKKYLENYKSFLSELDNQLTK